jgi:hypothetical protein
MLFEYKKKPPLRQNSFESNTKFTETEAQSIPLTHICMIPHSSGLYRYFEFFMLLCQPKNISNFQSVKSWYRNLVWISWNRTFLGLSILYNHTAHCYMWGSTFYLHVGSYNEILKTCKNCYWVMDKHHVYLKSVSL